MPIISTKPQIITKNGSPRAVILDIEKYERLLEAAEDKKDLADLRKIKKGKTSFRELDGGFNELFILLKSFIEGEDLLRQKKTRSFNSFLNSTVSVKK